MKVETRETENGENLFEFEIEGLNGIENQQDLYDGALKGLIDVQSRNGQHKIYK